VDAEPVYWMEPLELRCLLAASGMIVSNALSDGAGGYITAYLADGSIDRTFGENGIALALRTCDPIQLEVQSDGKILLLTAPGSRRPAMVLRFNADGTPDASFGDNGRAPFIETTSVNSTALLLESDGSLLVAQALGDAGGQISLWHLTPAGQPDAAFGNAGHALVSSPIFPGGLGLAEAANGEATVFTWLIGDDTQGALLRVQHDGSPDTTFGDNGAVLLDLGEDWPNAYLMPDGTVYSLVPDLEGLEVTRFTRDGLRNESFGDHGTANVDVDPGMVAAAPMQMSDGRVIIPSFPDEGGFGLVSMNADGTPDQTFGGGAGFVHLPRPHGQSASSIGAALGDRSQILTASNYWNGDSFTQLLAVFNSDGTIDTSFGDEGVVAFDLVPPDPNPIDSSGEGDTADQQQDDNDVVEGGVPMPSSGVFADAPDGDQSNSPQALFADGSLDDSVFGPLSDDVFDL
jgi:uncharacterized delta-60 repeat protein